MINNKKYQSLLSLLLLAVSLTSAQHSDEYDSDNLICSPGQIALGYGGPVGNVWHTPFELYAHIYARTYITHYSKRLL